ncbi:MAG: divergent polysaccharide deacetylase family protein [Thiohalomonadaceae bacterium]
MIDDVGDRLDLGRRAAALPAPVTLAFLPHTPFAARLAHEAHAAGKEIMLHLPMESVVPRPLGPGGVTLHMDEAQVRRTLEEDLAAIPHVRGINNHMGSLLTPHPGHMAWLMDALRTRGDLYFIDSRTTARSVAVAMAREHGVPHLVRDVFLDPDPAPERIAAQWARAVALAREHGQAVVIGHPYPETLALLERELPRLAAQGCRVVPPLALIAANQQRSSDLWQASLSPSPPAAKNSKP